MRIDRFFPHIELLDSTLLNLVLKQIQQGLGSQRRASERML